MNHLDKLRALAEHAKKTGSPVMRLDTQFVIDVLKDVQAIAQPKPQVPENIQVDSGGFG